MKSRTGLLAMSVLVLAACGGGGGSSGGGGSAGGNGGGTPPPAAFNTSATSPSDGATLQADFPLSVRLDAPVDPATVDALSFSVTAGVNPVPGSFSYSEDNRVIVFTPDADLVNGTDYTVTLSPDILSASGDALATTTWTFTASATANYGCTITAPPAALGVDAYYTKYCDADGIPVLGGALLPDAALQRAWSQARYMLKMRQDLLEEMVNQGTRIAIVSKDEGITDLPEYANLDTTNPLPGGQLWDDRSRGFGAVPGRPVSSGAEENLLCLGLGDDRYNGESIFVHEFAHSIHLMGLNFAEPGFEAELNAAYDAAMLAGTYDNTYATENAQEYWAEGVQNWFNLNLEAIPSDGIHNAINTRAELKASDPTLHELLSRIFPENWGADTCVYP